ncbi:hypothetical protein E2C01_063576 [Portunus trituberculatus]|uniref:Uncharacterized protein n=1 Tax=Portunus trituberculatus TaxID=210409 RepID=A0A5B7HGQ5_PORTR|nr:hypothetical protein [Portunus trituberculatus]
MWLRKVEQRRRDAVEEGGAWNNEGLVEGLEGTGVWWRGCGGDEEKEEEEDEEEEEEEEEEKEEEEVVVLESNAK